MSEKEESAEQGQKCVCLGAGPELTGLLRKLGFGSAAREHFRAARIELLKGIRSLIDERIDQLSRPEKKGAKVAVE